MDGKRPNAHSLFRLKAIPFVAVAAIAAAVVAAVVVAVVAVIGLLSFDREVAAFSC